MLRRIFSALVDRINSRGSANHSSPEKKVSFVRAGNTVPKINSKRKVSSLLNSATDWNIGADFDLTPFDFPAEICGTSQRPDIVVWSPLSKIVILIELTCPAEEGIQNATNRKQERYTDLQLLIRQNNWKSHLFTIEVGARGFVAKSTIKMFRALGFSYGDTSRIAKDLMAIAARCSYAIYVARENPFWDVNKSLLHLASAEQGEEINSSTSLSVEQKQRIQAHKAKALAILKNKKCVSESKCDILGHPAAVVPSHASLSIKDKARSVRWADM